ncbi:hypothetical protein VTN96DRAFT_8656 [Rasamsonia emersonii]
MDDRPDASDALGSSLGMTNHGTAVSAGLQPTSVLFLRDSAARGHTERASADDCCTASPLFNRDCLITDAGLSTAWNSRMTVTSIQSCSARLPTTSFVQATPFAVQRLPCISFRVCSAYAMWSQQTVLIYFLQHSPGQNLFLSLSSRRRNIP